MDTQDGKQKREGVVNMNTNEIFLLILAIVCFILLTIFSIALSFAILTTSEVAPAIELRIMTVVILWLVTGFTDYQCIRVIKR